MPGRYSHVSGQNPDKVPSSLKPPRGLRASTAFAHSGTNQHPGTVDLVSRYVTPRLVLDLLLLAADEWSFLSTALTHFGHNRPVLL
jgi:hypothetical protein